MRRLLAATALALFGALARAQSPVTTRDVPNLLPAGTAVEQFVVTADSQRTYYAPPSGGIWMYDRRTRTASRVSDVVAWDLALAPADDALVYTKAGETRRDQDVWLVSLLPTTGLTAGEARRLSSGSGDVPAISPDGKWVALARDDANGVGQSVVLVPVNGGSERVVAANLPSAVSAMRFTPDSKTLYFGVNPPVPFTCAESCLTGARESRPQATIRRVDVDGKSLETVVTVGSPFPGLSPDGRFLAFRDTGTSRRFVVSDAQGRDRRPFTPPPGANPHTWMGGSTLLTLASGQVRRLRTLSLPDGTPRVLFESAEFALEPAWLRDGRSVSLMRFTGLGCELKILNSDSSAQRSIVLSSNGGCVGASFTADQRWVVFMNFRPNDTPVIAAVEVATGQRKDLRTLADENAEWLLDNDVVLVTETAAADGGQRRASVWQVDLAGQATLLRAVTVEQGGSITLVDRTRALVMHSNREFRIVPLTGNGDERVLLPALSGFVYPRPTLSVDREWLALRVAPAGGDNTRLTTLELVRLDGTARHTVELPFIAEAGPSVTVLPNASGVVLAERRRQDQAPGVYLVDVATSKSTKLFTYTVGGRFPELAVSPDGRTLLYLSTETPPPSVKAIDVAALAAPR